MKEDRYLIIGGKGKTGRKVASKLELLGKNIRIGSRSETPSFDWYNSDTWPAALDGIDSVYITFQPDLAIPGAAAIIDNFSSLAVKSGVQKLVLLSGKGEREAEHCEEIVKNSGADWAIVRASWFNQNFSESFLLDPILSGHVALPKSEMLIPFIDTDDIADVVVEVLLNDAHNSQTYELTGPRQLTFRQIVEEISESIGREIKFTPLSLDQYSDILKEIPLPEDYIWLINYLFAEVLTDKNSAISNDVKKVLGREAKDFSEYIKETATSGIWTPSNTIEDQEEKYIAAN